MPGRMHLVHASGCPTVSTAVFVHVLFHIHDHYCPAKVVSGQTTFFGWWYGYGNLLEQVWKTSANGISIAI